MFDDALLNIIFGGFAYGLMTVLALKRNASTGGTDFIALYVSNKIGKSIWEYVFVFNATLIVIFGFMFGWEYAGYSILFQFISTKTIDSFYNRYERMTLQITTAKPDEVIYSGHPVSLLHTVVSSYEVNDIVEVIRSVDDKVIINAFKTENFYGGFYLKPIE